MWGFTVRSLALAALLVLTAASPARAERILLLPVGGTPSLEAEATRLVARLVDTLEAAGHEARMAQDHEIELAASVLGCDTSACASAGLLALDVGVIVAPALWSAPLGRHEFSLSAIGTRAVGIESSRTFVTSEAPEACAALAAELVANLDRLASAPVGEAQGDAGDARASLITTPPRRRRSAWNAGLGLSLVLVGIAPLSLAGVSLARRGECVTTTREGHCPLDADGRYEVYDFGPRSIAFMAGGIGAVGAGVYLLAARPIRIRPIADVSGRASGLGIDLVF